jgi:ankyrin repeat protein
MIHILHKYNINFNPNDSNGETPLHVAANNKQPNIEIIKTLLNYNADVNSTSLYQRMTALHRAADKGSAEAVKLLLAYKANANLHRFGERTPLHDAAEEGHNEIVRILIDSDANMEVADNKKKTPLLLAAYNGHYGTVKELLSHGADPTTIISQEKQILATSNDQAVYKKIIEISKISHEVDKFCYGAQISKEAMKLVIEDRECQQIFMHRSTNYSDGHMLSPKSLLNLSLAILAFSEEKVYLAHDCEKNKTDTTIAGDNEDQEGAHI